MNRINRGFTLIELLVVIAIIGILSSVVLASLNSARSKGRDARRISDMKQLQLALELYYDANDQSYPPAADLSPLAPDFISTVPLDPQNSSPYVYTYQALSSGGTPTACASGTCPSYVLRAATENPVPAGDVDGTFATLGSCEDSGITGVSGGYYCVRP